MIKGVILKTAGMFENRNPNDYDYQLWKQIADFMDGEPAIVADSKEDPEKYVFLYLEDSKKDKELFYMMEQDSVMGTYIGNREEFDTAWEAGEYEPCGCFYLEKKYIEIKN